MPQLCLQSKHLWTALWSWCGYGLAGFSPLDCCGLVLPKKKTVSGGVSQNQILRRIWFVRIQKKKEIGLFS